MQVIIQLIVTPKKENISGLEIGPKNSSGQLQGSDSDENMYGGAWCAETEETNHWFEVDARREVEFTGVITQGRNSENK